MKAITLKTAALIGLIIFILGFAAGFAVSKHMYKCEEAPVVSAVREIKTVRDTVKAKVPPAVKETVKRKETARLKIKPSVGTKTPTIVNDSLAGTAEVEIPITTKIYETPNYRAVVSGFRPSLDSMEVYRDTRTITETVTKLQPARRKWLALTVGPSIGYNLNGEIVPSASVTLGIILLSK